MRTNMSHQMTRVRVPVIAAALAFSLALVPMSSLGAQPLHPSLPTTSQSIRPRASAPVVVLPTPIASFTTSVPGFTSPGGAVARLVNDKWLGAPLITPIIASKDGYYKVRLPMRPNGSTTWVKASDVLVSSSPYRIDVNLKTTHLQLLKLGHVVYNFPVGVGVAADPTPTGSFFVTFYAKPDGPGYGPWMMMTSAHSTAIKNWSGTGDALISLHGPLGADHVIGTTGARVSHGCIRLHVVDQMKLIVVPDGTPIQISN
jgi:lipoprotein-anchoring transpeptidase ErfK/SrfK